jgi:hypothetical protein
MSDGTCDVTYLRETAREEGETVDGRAWRERLSNACDSLYLRDLVDLVNLCDRIVTVIDDIVRGATLYERRHTVVRCCDAAVIPS